MSKRHIVLAGVLVMISMSTQQQATAQSVESLVMPGEVIRGHAEIESECSSCHKRFRRSEQDALCLDCHEDVAADKASGGGFHGKSVDVGQGRCATCHTDHEGRSADILGLDAATFDHLLTDFELIGKHAEVDCASCHAPSDKHRDAPGDCVDCHRADDAHEGFHGDACGDCHSPTDWTDTAFDHDTTNFPLLGRHRDADCGDCHVDLTHQNTPDTCFGCHSNDDVHEGRSGEQCDNCHNPVGWQDTSFDHARNTGFALDGEHALLSCGDCHSEDPFDDVMDMACVACHLDDDDHGGHYGRDCAACHSTKTWSESLFDHNVATDFSLHGSHQTVACADCHIEPMFDAAPASNCASCHIDDQPHAGRLGEQCDNCHNEDNWQEPPFFDHGLTQFPLLGEHDNIECDDCHGSRLFVDTDSDCVSCHRDDDSHDGAFEERCGNCHNPVAWDLWLFDHNAQTDFPLSGAHIDVSCDNCHRSTLTTMRKTGDRCADCHRADDIHDGEFGPDCGRCHSDSSFKDVRALQ